MSKIYYGIFEGKSAFVAMAKKEPFILGCPDPTKEPGEICFQIDENKENAMKKIKEEMERTEV